MKQKIYIEAKNDGTLNVTLKHLIKHDEPLFNIQDLDFQPKKGDKLYLLPAVNIPRVKVKQFNEENGTKTVRDAKIADYIFGSSKSQYEYVNSTGGSWYSKMPVTDIEKLLPFFSSHLNIDPTDISDFQDVLEAHKLVNENLEIYYSYPTTRTFKDIIEKYKIDVCDSYDDSETHYVLDAEFINEVEELQNLTIYNVNALINAVNAKNVTIDYEMFGQLTNMFKSNDRDNHVLAMEIMANSNVTDSLLFIEMLFKDHAGNIYDCHTRNHVNFKSLCSTIGKDKYRFNTTIDDIVKSLNTFNVLTADKLDILMNHYSKEIQSNGNTQFFKVKNITVSDEIHKILNQNYVFVLKDNYEPVAQEEEEVLEEEVLEEELVEAVNTESLNIESVEEEPSFELSDVNVIEEEITETIEEVVEETEITIENTQEEVIVEPNKEEEDESSIDWF